MAHDDSAPEEYLRFRLNVQLGDGPDQRGDVTVEQRTGVGPKYKSADRAFADFVQQVGRGRDLLANSLGMEDHDLEPFPEDDDDD